MIESILGSLIGGSVGTGWANRRALQNADDLADEGIFVCAIRLVEGKQSGLTGGGWRLGEGPVEAGRIRVEGHSFTVTCVDIGTSRVPRFRESFALPGGVRVYPAVGPESRLELATYPKLVRRLAAALASDS